MLLGFGESSHHVEGSFGKFISRSLEQSSESLDGVGQFDDPSGPSGEDLRHEEGLGQESFDLPGSGDSDLIFFGQLVHSQDGDDILERLVVLEQLLDVSGGVVVQLSDDGGIEHSRGRVQGVHGGVDSELSQGSVQHGSGVEMGEGGGWGGVGKIISGHVDGLDGGDGSFLGCRDSLLKGSQISGEGGLVSDGGGDTSKQGGHLGAGLGESEDVVDKEQHILSLVVSEVLSDGQAGQADSSSGTRGLVHLAVDQRSLGTRAIGDDHLRVDHLVVQIISLSGSLSDSGEDGVPSVLLGDVVNQLHDEHSLADSGSSEKSNFTSSSVRSKKINNLNT